MIVVATWPMLLMLQRWLLGRRWLAVTVMTLLLLAIFLLPFRSPSAPSSRISRRLPLGRPRSPVHTPSPPDWLGKIPLVGARAASQWQQVAALSREDWRRAYPHTWAASCDG